MKKTLLALMLFACGAAYAAKPMQFTAATSPEIRFVGRAGTGSDGSLSFDWSGSHFEFRFDGTQCAMRASDTHRNYYNVFVDGKQLDTVTVAGDAKSIQLASGLKKGIHTVLVQKRTEGEQGRTTLYGIETDGQLLEAPAAKQHFIEFIGDSHTCGYGTEGHLGEPFKPETENCDLAWGCVVARYFDADYALIAHSGQGIVRNYGDMKVVSDVTMRERMMRTYDMDAEPQWDFKGYKPDIVVIKLGTNDFSTEISPSEKVYNESYAKAIKQIRAAYGTVPVLCVAPSGNPEIYGYLQDFKAQQNDPDLHIAVMTDEVNNWTSDMGANFHPNLQGHRKLAMSMIPYIATITGWSLPETAVN